jgi:uncharacterized protein YecE (DUF72 family)
VAIRYRFGCSGWDYEEWIGPFYRSARGSKLAAYAAVFDTAEINSTFYRPPARGMVHGWVRYTPEDFVFAAKVPQTVTHERLLDPEKGAAEEAAAFGDLMRPLLDAGKLGPLLLQLPPRLRFDPPRVAPFLEALPTDFPWALEPRNRTWIVPEAFDLLAAHGVAYAIVDEPLLPPEVRVTAPLAYVRWHGHGRKPWYNYRYSEEELRQWLPRIEHVASQTSVLYGFFNNHFHGYAPENCLQVLAMLGVATEDQRRKLAEIQDYRRGVLRQEGRRLRATTLDAFTEGGLDPTLEFLLRQLLDPRRLERARRLDPDLVTLLVDEPERVEGRVGAYQVLVDVAAKRVVHDCEDWRKGREEGRFCKHLGRFALNLPPDRAASLLRRILGEKSLWSFEVPR